MATNQRPMNLSLITMDFPITAIVSILHRITGVVIFLSIPFVLCAFEQSLRSEQSFNALKTAIVDCKMVRLAINCLMIAVVYHTLAGIRHIIMDMGIGETLTVAHKSSYALIVLTLIVAITIGYKLW